MRSFASRITRLEDRRRQSPGSASEYDQSLEDYFYFLEVDERIREGAESPPMVSGRGAWTSRPSPTLCPRFALRSDGLRPSRRRPLISGSGRRGRVSPNTTEETYREECDGLHGRRPRELSPKGRGRGAPSRTGAPRAGRQEPVATHGVETSTQESAE